MIFPSYFTENLLVTKSLTQKIIYELERCVVCVAGNKEAETGVGSGAESQKATPKKINSANEFSAPPRAGFFFGKWRAWARYFLLEEG